METSVETTRESERTGLYLCGCKDEQKPKQEQISTTTHTHHHTLSSYCKFHLQGIYNHHSVYELVWTTVHHMWDMPLCLPQGAPCGFSTFFSISMMTNVTAHDAHVTPQTNFRYSEWQCNTFHANLNFWRRKAFSVPIKMPVRIEKEFMLSIPSNNFENMTFCWKITRF